MIRECEREFIWNSFGKYLNGNSGGDIGILSAEIGRERVSRLIHKYELQFAFSDLESRGEITLDDSTSESLKVFCRKTCFFNEILEDMSEELFDVFLDGKVDFVFFKGLVTLRRLYRKGFPRRISDIDIFIDAGDYVPARNALKSAGYSINHEYYDKYLRSRRIEEKINMLPEITYVKRIGKIEILIDLHFSMNCFKESSFRNKIYGFDVNPFLECEFMELKNGKKIKIPNINFDFFNSIMHMAVHHGFTGFKWLSDICLYISKFHGEIEWGKVLSWADSAEKARILLYTVYIACGILGFEENLIFRAFPEWEKQVKENFVNYLRRSFFTDRKSLNGKINARFQQALIFPCGIKKKAAVVADLFKFF